MKSRITQRVKIVPLVRRKRRVYNAKKVLRINKISNCSRDIGTKTTNSEESRTEIRLTENRAWEDMGSKENAETQVREERHKKIETNRGKYREKR